MSDCTTWVELGQLVGPVLLIVNSPKERTYEIETTLQVLSVAASADDLRVIAPSEFLPLLAAAGVDAANILPARVGDSELELYYFLESEHALQWIAKQEPRTIIGTAPHSLYNSEIKNIFELRVCIFLSGSALLAHTLPGKYVYVLDTDALLDRAGRETKVAAYRRTVDALLEDFHAQWQARGCPTEEDTPDYGDVAATIARHLGSAVLDYDEVSPIPIPRVDTTADQTLVLRFVRSRLIRSLRRLPIPPPTQP